MNHCGLSSCSLSIWACHVHRKTPGAATSHNAAPVPTVTSEMSHLPSPGVGESVPPADPRLTWEHGDAIEGGTEVPQEGDGDATGGREEGDTAGRTKPTTSQAQHPFSDTPVLGHNTVSLPFCGLCCPRADAPRDTCVLNKLPADKAETQPTPSCSQSTSVWFHGWGRGARAGRQEVEADEKPRCGGRPCRKEFGLSSGKVEGKDPWPSQQGHRPRSGARPGVQAHGPRCVVAPHPGSHV